MKANPYSSILLVALTFAITLTAAAKGPQKKVLFELESNEIIDEMEYSSSFHLGRYGFSCILRDTTTNLYTFVWNGERKVSAPSVYLQKINLEDFEKCVLSFRDCNDVEHLQTAGEIYSFEESNYVNFPIAAITSDSSIYQIVFKKMGVWYVRDYDGTIYEWYSNRTEFESRNGKHKAQIINGGQIIIDGAEITLPPSLKIFADYPNPQWANHPETSIYVLNNGGCYLECDSEDYNEDLSYRRSYYIKDGQICDLSKDNLILNLDSGELQKIPQKIKSAEENTLSFESFYWYGNYFLQDLSKKHTFFGNWQYDYVLIDDVKYGQSCPVDAYYDKKLNAFIWSVFEGQKLIQYTYEL